MPLWPLFRLLSSRSFGYFFSVQAIIIGAWLETVFGENWLSRVGVFLLIFALVQLWMLLRYGEEAERMASQIENMTKHWSPGKSAIELEDIQRKPPIIVGGDTEEGIKNTYKNLRYIWPKRVQEVKKHQKNLARAQIEVAGLGTLLAGFGDMLM